MKIKIHNCFEVFSGSKVYRAYNEVLSGINQRFLSGENYTKYIVFGSGSHADTSGITGLDSFLGGKESAVYGKNFDITAGQVYLKKCIEIGAGEFDGEMLSEIALSPQNDGQNIVNYAKLYDENGNLGITKTAGESLTVIITLYLNIEAGGGYVCGGDNPLFYSLFGLKGLGLYTINAVFSDLGEGGSIKREDFEKCSFVPSSIGITGENAVIEAILLQETRYPEILFTFDGVAALRLAANDYENCRYEKTLRLPLKNGAAAVIESGLEDIESISFNGTAQAYGSCDINCGAADTLKTPFGFVLRPDDKIFSCGEFFAVYGGDILDFYRIENGVLNVINRDYLNFSVYDLKDAAVDINGNCYFLTGSPPYFCVSKFEGGILKACSPSRTYGANITSVKTAHYNGGTHVYRYTYENGVYGFEDNICSFNGLVYIETPYRSYSGGQFSHFYDCYAETQIFYDKANKSFTFYPSDISVSEKALEALKVCDYASVNKNIVLITTGGKVTMFNLFTGEEKKLYESGVRKIYAGAEGKAVVKLFSNNKTCGYNIEGNTGLLYVFETGKRIGGSITDIRLLDVNGLIISSKTAYTDNYFLPSKGCGKFVFVPALADGDIEADVAVSGYNFGSFAGRKLKCSLCLH